MKKALLLVDIQNDYFPGGKMELVGMDEAAAQAQALLAAFPPAAMAHFHIQHVSTPGRSALLSCPAPQGWISMPASHRFRVKTVIEKHFPNSFRDTGLPEVLTAARVGELVICGAMSHMCIDATTRAGVDLGFSCTVIHDACATRDLVFGETVIPARQVHGAFMAALASFYARVLSLEEFLNGL